MVGLGLNSWGNLNVHVDDNVSYCYFQVDCLGESFVFNSVQSAFSHREPIELTIDYIAGHLRYM